MKPINFFLLGQMYFRIVRKKKKSYLSLFFPPQSLMLAERACVYTMLINLMESRESGEKTQDLLLFHAQLQVTATGRSAGRVDTQNFTIF